jgi:lipopolysaccharide O-acetyltransferase
LSQKLTSRGRVQIGRGTFVGYRASIMDGVSLGRHCVVGANSVVTRSFPDGSMLAGCPARRIKFYCPVSKQWLPEAQPG